MEIFLMRRFGGCVKERDFCSLRICPRSIVPQWSGCTDQGRAGHLVFRQPLATESTIAVNLRGTHHVLSRAAPRTIAVHFHFYCRWLPVHSGVSRD